MTNGSSLPVESAAYFAIDKPDIGWLVRPCFLFFVALGPIYWVQELLVELHWNDDSTYGGFSIHLRARRGQVSIIRIALTGLFGLFLEPLSLYQRHT